MTPTRAQQSGRKTAPLGDDTRPGESLRPGAIVGRYVIVEPLGAGGGGAVYAAYDAHLGRRVAVKVLGTRSESGEETWTRLIQEAQLIARLDHPNVVTVHDVGVADDRAFIAMELVRGTDLATWLSQQHAAARPPRWHDVARPFLLAGRGLAAAHGRHVVHGDFKPANVLIGEDTGSNEGSDAAFGRVRVTDFGVARLRDHQGPVDHALTHRASHGSDRIPSVEMLSTADDDTAPRSLWGTPLYMAPELFDGLKPDVASDVYSYCASLYEAMWGRPPAQGASLMALYAAKLEPVEIPRGTAVPRILREVIAQGLDADPMRRPSSVAAVLGVIERCLRPTRRRYAYVATAVTVSAAFAVLGVHAYGQDASCAHADRHLAGIWDGDVREALTAAMVGTGLSYAVETSARVARHLDRYADDWAAQHTEACLATRRGEQSQALLDRRMMCLGERREGLHALTGALLQPGDGTVEDALDAVLSLPSLATCNDAERLLDDVEAPADSPQVLQLRQEIARARSLANTGQLDEAGDRLQAARARAEEIGDVRSMVEAIRWLGDVEQSRGNLERAQELLQEAALSAEVEKVDDVAANAGIALMFMLAADKGDPQEARDWVPHVDVAVRRAKPGPETEIKFYHARGLIEVDLQQHDAALADFRRAEELLDELADPRPHHADLTNALGYLYHQRSDWDLSEKYYRESLALKRDLYGPSHPGVGRVLDNVATAVMARGDHEEALKIDEQAYEVLRAAYGDQHTATVTVRANMAGTLAELGRLDEAATAYRGIIDFYEKEYGGEHVYIAGSQLNLAAVLGRQGDYVGAAALCRAALGVVEDKYGDTHPWVGYALINLGTAELRLHEYEGSVEHLERALRVLASQPDASSKLAQGRFALAQALVESGGDPTRAIGLTHQALEGFREGSEEHRRARDWLDAR